MADVIPAPTPVRIPVRGGGHFPVRRVYCVGRNFADHAREMGATAPASKDERGQPVFFLKPADAVVPGGDVPYPPGTQDLHHEVELVVALGQDAPPGVLDAMVAAPTTTPNTTITASNASPTRPNAMRTNGWRGLRGSKAWRTRDWNWA